MIKKYRTVILAKLEVEERRIKWVVEEGYTLFGWVIWRRNITRFEFYS